MARSRPLRAAGVGVGLAAFCAVAFVFPAIHDRDLERAAQDPPAVVSSVEPTPSAADTTVPDSGPSGTSGTVAPIVGSGTTDPYAHPVPTAEQDRVYDEQTRQLAPHPGLAVEGRDGYVFLGDTYIDNFAQATGRVYYTPEQVDALATEVSDRKAWLAAAGISSEFIVVPAVWSVYPDKMPAWTDGSVLPHILDQLIARDPLDFPDLRPALQLSRSAGPTYSRLNSHWTEFGAWAGWSAIAQRIEADAPQLGPVPVPQISGVQTLDVNNEFAAITGAAGPNDWAVPTYLSPLSPFTVTDGSGATTVNPGNQLLDTSAGPFLTSNPSAANQKRVLILADSTTVMLSTLLGSTFGTTSIVRHFLDQPEKSPNIPALIEDFKPDLVLTLVSERNLGVVEADPETYGAALAFDRGTSTVGSWTADAAAGGIDVRAAETAGATLVTGLPAGPLAMRFDVDATAAGNATLTADGSADGDTFHLAAGRNVVYRSVPAGFAGGQLTLGAADGNSVTVTRLEIRTPG